MAERRKNLPIVRQELLIEARDLLIRIARMPGDEKGTPFVTALQFNSKELFAIQDMLRSWIERDSGLLMEALHGR